MSKRSIRSMKNTAKPTAARPAPATILPSPAADSRAVLPGASSSMGRRPSNAVRGWLELQPGLCSVLSHRVLVGYCLTAALSIAVSQVALFLLIAIWLLPGNRRESLRREVYAPIAAWFTLTVLTGIVALDPARSIPEAFKGGLALLFPICVADSFLRDALPPRECIRRIEMYIAALLLGQCLAAVHTVLVDGCGLSAPWWITTPGAMTESGQIVMILPLLICGTLFALNHASLKDDLPIRIGPLRVAPGVYAGLFLMLLLVIAWPGEVLGEGFTSARILPRLAALAILLLLALPPLRRGAPRIREKLEGLHTGPHGELFQLLWPAAALLLTALLMNLKRGPWLGAFVEFAVIGFLLSRRFLFWSVAISFTLLLSFSPTRNRIAELDDHFNIQGGRRVMWELGEELAQRYPLGIGLKSARYIQVLDPTIPYEHRHVHNNLLNVVVETGWLGLSVYLWWMVSIIRLGFRSWRRSTAARDPLHRQFGTLALCLSLALIGWQAAGLVEYNFGDAEIRFIAFLFMALIMVIDHLFWRLESRPIRETAG